MAVSFVAGAGAAASATSVTATLPGAPADGDVLYATVITNSAAAQPITGGAGWVSLKTQASGGGNQTALLRLIASGSGAGHTFSCSDAAFMEVNMRQYTGNDTTTPEDATSTSGAGTAATITFPDITSVTANTIHAVFAVDTSGLPTMPGGSYVNQISSPNFWRSKDAPIAGTGLITGVTGSGGTAWAAYSVLVKPAGGGGSATGRLVNGNLVNGSLIGSMVR